MSFGEEFTYDVLKDELVIGEVYVRVYNEQPTFVLEVIFIVLSSTFSWKRVMNKIHLQFFNSVLREVAAVFNY